MKAITKLTRCGLLTLFLAGLCGQAQPHMINYQGRVEVGGTPVDGTAYFKFALVDNTPAPGTTTYWSNDGTSAGGGEPTDAVTLTVSKGLYSVRLGDTSLAHMTQPVTPAELNHSDVRLRLWFSQTEVGPYTLLTPDQRVVSVTYALRADTVVDGAVTAEKLSPGLATSEATPNALARRDGSGNFAAGTITGNLNGNAATATSAGGFTGGLVGDVTGTQGATVVTGVGGVTAANVASGANLANGATSANTPHTVLRRDGGGNFAAGSVTLAGQLALPASASAGVGALTIGGTPALHTYGSQNSFVGGSGNFTMSGGANTANGLFALRNNTSGGNNTAIGYSALSANTAGLNNTAAGFAALGRNTDGFDNTANGYLALYFNTTGAGNTASGASALLNNTTGRGNTATGDVALESNTTGNDNTANGLGALNANTMGEENTASGAYALGSNTTGNQNTASGSAALRNNTSGYNNTADGAEALYANTTGYGNTAIGNVALKNNTTGDRNTAAGVGALYANTTGYWNTANGMNALRNNTTGYINTAGGVAALESNTTGQRNTACGYYALHDNTDGDNNIAIGYQAGRNLTTGDNNIDIGNIGVAGETGIVRIGTAGTHTKTHLSGDVYGLSFNPTSDRNAKGDFAAVEPGTVLEKLAALPISSWRFKQQGDARHIGPMAQDFHAAFGLGTDDRHIATVDADGVALAAIQGLNQKLEQRLREREQEIAQLRQSLDELRQIVSQLAEQIGTSP